MLIPVMLGLEAGVAPPSALGTPTVSVVTNGALCQGPNCTTKSGAADTIQVNWTITGPNNIYYQTKVYRDGSLVATLSNTTTQYTETAPGAQGWNGGPVGYSHTFRVDVVSLVDGTVVLSQTGSLFSQTFQTTCPGPC